MMMKTWLWIPVLIAGADQVIKCIIRCAPLGFVFYRIDGFLEITYSANTGAAFSVLSGKTGLIASLSAILLVLLLFILLRSMKLTHMGRMAVVCLVGGGAGNLIDRLAFSYVTDYIRLLFIEFPVFNLADIVITCSVIGLLFLLAIGRLEENAGEEHGSN